MGWIKSSNNYPLGPWSQNTWMVDESTYISGGKVIWQYVSFAGGFQAFVWFGELIGDGLSGMHCIC